MERNDDTGLGMVKELMLPYLQIHGTAGQEHRMDIVGDQITIGRLSDANDIALAPDPHKFITRHMHCAIEKEGGYFWIIDNASKNGTFLRRGSEVSKVQGKDKLESGDVILILVSIADDGKPEYWEITFIDPQATEEAGIEHGKPYLEYDWVQARLFLIGDASRKEIEGLRPQEHSLIRYMDQHNQRNGNVPVMCTYDELIEAVWDELGELHTSNDISRLVWELRQKIEKDTQQPEFLQTIRGMGYRLVTNP